MKIGKFKRTVSKTTDPNHFVQGSIPTANVYAGKNIPIKKQKVVTITNTKTGANRVKTVDYGPADYYGKQSKTKTITKKGKLLK